MHIKQIRVRLSSQLHDRFYKHLPGHGERSRAVRRFVRIFCEECERWPMMASAELIDQSALQAAQDILGEEDTDGDV